MEEFKFEASDFEARFNHIELKSNFIAQDIASLANAKLKEYLDKCPTVYGFCDGEWWSEKSDCTHSAKLFDIKKLNEIEE